MHDMGPCLCEDDAATFVSLKTVIPAQAGTHATFDQRVNQLNQLNQLNRIPNHILLLLPKPRNPQPHRIAFF